MKKYGADVRLLKNRNTRRSSATIRQTPKTVSNSSTVGAHAFHGSGTESRRWFQRSTSRKRADSRSERSKANGETHTEKAGSSNQPRIPTGQSVCDFAGDGSHRNRNRRAIQTAINKASAATHRGTDASGPGGARRVTMT